MNSPHAIQNQRAKIEYGDFQTPQDLAVQVCSVVKHWAVSPKSLLEPTCGEGNLLIAALDAFPNVDRVAGVDVKEEYLEILRSRLASRGDTRRVRLRQGDFFEMDWGAIVDELPSPLLVIGNPPWVTNSAIGTLAGRNLPPKENSSRLHGIEALTGRSNFDISEWMLLKMLDWVERRSGDLAMLCKTSVARRVIQKAWEGQRKMMAVRLHRIDAKTHFNAAVEACLLVAKFGNGTPVRHCEIHNSLDSCSPGQVMSFQAGILVADRDAYERSRHLAGRETRHTWRSGVKHDCSKIMELRKVGEGLYRNGLGEEVALEDVLLFPMLKGSEVHRGSPCERWMIIPQRSIGEDTAFIRHCAPMTWRYLECHEALLNARASSIYKDRPRFSIFGVGDYTFAPWKVAVPALYKHPRFRAIGPTDGKPVIFDDTTYFVPCATQAEGERLASLLNSKSAQDFFRAFVFWDAKRPITIQLLSMLDFGNIEMDAERKLAPA